MTSSETDPIPADPVSTNPGFYSVLWENEDVRVLEYRDVPGQETTPHAHPNTVLVALTDFERRLSIEGRERIVALTAGSAQWLPAQSHTGRNIGTTPTWTILVELKHSRQLMPTGDTVGPTLNRTGP